MQDEFNENQKEILQLRQNIMEAENQRLRGDKTYSIEEIRKMLRQRQSVWEHNIIQ